MTISCKSIFPANIRTVAVTAPAGLPDREKLRSALRYLKACNVNVVDYIADKGSEELSYLAASAEHRAASFNQAINDPSVDMILCARGGFGCVHILDRIDFGALQQRQLPVMGYSDISALHCAMLKNSAGIAIAGSNLIGIEQAAQDTLSLTTHRTALDRQQQKTNLAPSTLKQLRPVLPGATPAVNARAYAGNLSVLTSLCGTEFMPDFRGMILILEDVNEAVYKLDRMLTQLLHNGIFDQLQMLIFGDFSGADARELDILQKRLASQLAIPCLKNFPFGHRFPMNAVNSALLLEIPEVE
ncbi:MAG: LD-carboxypeptidase [Lentisphaerae bacterium]|nr:LD-carboxypeptidase [Lentisphaerota bacterium]